MKHFNFNDRLFSTLKDSFGDYIAVGGSTVLKALGILQRDVEDVDIVLPVCNRKALEFVKVLARFSPVIENPYDGPDYDGYMKGANDELGVREHIRFCIKGVKYCVFVISNREFVNSTVSTDNGTRTATVNSILRAKRAYLKYLPKSHPSRFKHQHDVALCEQYISDLHDSMKFIGNI